MKTHIPLTDDPAQEDLLRKYRERVERLSQQNRVIKICTDAGFLNTVEVGQYFMTKDTEKFSQFTDSVACREYTLPRDENSSEPKGWIRGNTKIGPVLEVTTCYLQVKFGVEIRIESVNKDNSHSWVRMSHGLNKLVTAWSTKSTTTTSRETSETKTEVFALKTEVLAFASRSKTKAKPQRRISANSSTKTIPIGERTWTDIEPQDYFSIDYPVSKKLITLLRHHLWKDLGLKLSQKLIRLSSVKETDQSSSSWSSTSRRRWSDLILEIRILSSERIWVLSTLVWWNVEEWNGRRRRQTRKDFNNVLTRQDKKFFSSELFKVIQDATSLILHCRTMY